MQKPRFYRCSVCGTVVGRIHDTGTALSCCGGNMEHLVPHRAGDPGEELCLPNVTRDEYRIHVTAGDGGKSAVEWVYLATDRGGQRKCSCNSVKNPDVMPQANDITFALAGEMPQAVYAYCGEQGLWEKEV
ncbi:MAG: hypothetical protein IJ449_00260 [Clostridia bacterium]|nr:hypothetical protein [Clostridia bacterium]